ncbi:hypothetical protein [Intrasporangium sp.]|uniref:hypothetical protein n=1 Tax=Intrasporangium sp. TaxID=1925024 RepID=UPI0032218328
MIRRHPTTSLVVTLTLVVAALAWAYVARPAIPVPPTQAPRPGQSLVVVGVGGVSWDDVSAAGTPTVWRMLRHGATATVSVKTLHATTCPTDGWATLGAGEAAGAPASARCGTLPQVTGGRSTGWQVAGFDTIARASAEGPYAAHLGLLGDSLARAGTCVQAVGPGAALAAATSDGRVARYAPFLVAGLTADLARCPVSLVDVGALAATGAGPDAPTEQLGSLDRRIGEVLAAAPAGADVLVVGISDRDGRQGLRILAALGPQYPAGLLTSASTRLTGITQLSDVTATVLARGGANPVQETGGRPLHVIPSPDDSAAAVAGRLTLLTDLAAKADAKQVVEVPFLLLWLGVVLLVFVALATAWHRAGPGARARRLRLARWAVVVGLVSAAMPAATFLADLVPWWRAEGVGLLVAVFTALVLAVSVVLTAIAARGPWGGSALGPVTALCAITAGVIGADLVTGSNLQVASIFGLQPLVGGRFYGMGNVAFALYGAAVLVLCAGLGHALTRRGRRGAAVGVVTAVAVLAVAVDVLPAWGADFGGPLALVPALGILLLAVAGVRTSVRNLAGVAAIAVLVVGLVSWLDWLRPPAQRSHPGRFVQSIIDGDAWAIVSRKFLANVELGLSMPVLFAVVVAVLVPFVVVVLHPGRLGTGAFARLCTATPLLRTGLLAVVVMSVIGLLTNDSGIAVPPVAAILVVPGTIAATMQLAATELRCNVPRSPSNVP